MEKKTPGQKRRWVENFALLITTCLLGLALCELSLRWFHPKYERVAEAEYARDDFRIWAKQPNGRFYVRHPDTGLYHSLHHNNLALRQGRDFSEQQIRSATNVGFFGDSFTENVDMASQYSFTEPLDYLLNLSGEPFNVLNFGVNGYGTGQSFLHYKYFQYREDLDYVFYVYYLNDIRNLYETDLFGLDEAGDLVQNLPPPAPWWQRFVSRLHVSYLLLDAVQRLSLPVDEDTSGLDEHSILVEIFREQQKDLHQERTNDTIAKKIHQKLKRGEMHDEKLRHNIDIFKHLLSEWKHLVEESGGKFYIVFLPEPKKQNIIPVMENGYEIIDLRECFLNHGIAARSLDWTESPYRFRNDAHWNEAGNQLAARCLYRFLEREASLPTRSDEAIRKSAWRYYSAFDGWMPEQWVKEVAVSPQASAAIRNTYIALDMERNVDDMEKSMVERIMSQAPSVGSRFDVYLDDRAARLVYVRRRCREQDTQERFFLRVHPLDKEDLPAGRGLDGFADLDFDFEQHRYEYGEDECVAIVPLPDYDLASIHTGQRGLWEGEVDFFDLHAAKMMEQIELDLVVPSVRSHFDVYFDERTDSLVYVRRRCREQDTQGRFFLRVRPLNKEDLPAGRGLDGFADPDFDFAQHRYEYGEDECVAIVPLPDYDLASIRTGQRGLWEGEVDFFDLHAAKMMERIELDLVVPSARSHFDVYSDARTNSLVYVRRRCREQDTQGRFFLRVHPLDKEDLPAGRGRDGFADLDFDFEQHRYEYSEDECVAIVPLPDYDLASIRTGQRGLWEGRLLDPRGMYRIMPKQVLPSSRSHFEVHLDERTTTLVYAVRRRCLDQDTQGRFFLHVFPVDENDLPHHRKQYGYDNLDFDFDQHRYDYYRTCLAIVPLPDYEIASIRTGQQVSGAGRSWESKVVLHDAEAASMAEKFLSNQMELSLNANFEVHFDKETAKLYYFRRRCREQDTWARFFLHVFPANQAVLPDHRKRHGYDNLDFDFDLRRHDYGASCLAIATLPDYDIASIRTGQYIHGKGHIWEGSFEVSEPVGNGEDTP